MAIDRLKAIPQTAGVRDLIQMTMDTNQDVSDLVERFTREISRKCEACGGDGYFKGARLGDEPCQECNGTGSVSV
jgi:DnaJ-class molecular chaperone